MVFFDTSTIVPKFESINCSLQSAARCSAERLPRTESHKLCELGKSHGDDDG